MCVSWGSIFSRPLVVSQLLLSIAGSFIKVAFGWHKRMLLPTMDKSTTQPRKIDISDEDLFWARCEHDRWFAAEHFAVVIDQMSANNAPAPLRPRPEQRELWRRIDAKRMQNKRQDIIMLKARAVGGSLGTMWGFYHDAMFNPHTRLLTTAHLDASVTPLVEYAENFIGLNEELPEDLKEQFSIKHSGGIYQFKNGSRWRFGTAKSPDQFKSDRATRALLTEMASYGSGSEDMERRLFEALDGAIPQHSNVTVVRESTSSGPRGRFYRMFMDAMNGRIDVDWLFFSFGSSQLYAFDCSPKELENDAILKLAVEKQDKDLYFRMCQELGYDERWAQLAVEYNLTPGQVRWGQQKCRQEYQDDLQLFLRNYPVSPHSAFDQSNRHFFPQQVMRLWRQTDKPSEMVVGSLLFEDENAKPGERIKIQAGGDAWQMYRLPKQGYEYVIGIDIASGTGGDYSAICVFCRNTREQVAEFYSNRIDPRELALQALYAREFYNNAMLVPESTDIGIAFIDLILQKKAGNALYRNSEIPDTVVNPINWTKAYGYPNRSKSARVQLLNTLRLECVGGLQVYSSRLLMEANTFIEVGDDKWDHQKGCNSDAIFALALAVWGHTQRPAVLLTSKASEQRNLVEGVSFLSLAAAKKLPPLPQPGRQGNYYSMQLGKPRPTKARYR